MARRKFYCNWEIPTSVVRIVYSICADYDRREKAIKLATAAPDAIEQMKLLNLAVDMALEQIEPAIRRDILSDISDGRGYNKSVCCVIMEKNTYYRRRRKLIYDIAVSMKLL